MASLASSSSSCSSSCSSSSSSCSYSSSSSTSSSPPPSSSTSSSSASSASSSSPPSSLLSSSPSSFRRRTDIEKDWENSNVGWKRMQWARRFGRNSQIEMSERQNKCSLRKSEKECVRFPKNIVNGDELLQDHDMKKEILMEEVRQWLISLDLEKYAQKFEEEEYNNMTLITALSKSQFNVMITAVGCKPGAVAKIEQSLSTVLKEKMQEVELQYIDTENKKKWLNHNETQRQPVARELFRDSLDEENEKMILSPENMILPKSGITERLDYAVERYPSNSSLSQPSYKHEMSEYEVWARDIERDLFKIEQELLLDAEQLRLEEEVRRLESAQRLDKIHHQTASLERSEQFKKLERWEDLRRMGQRDPFLEGVRERLVKSKEEIEGFRSRRIRRERATARRPLEGYHPTPVAIQKYERIEKLVPKTEVKWQGKKKQDWNNAQTPCAKQNIGLNHYFGRPFNPLQPEVNDICIPDSSDLNNLSDHLTPPIYDIGVQHSAELNDAHRQYSSINNGTHNQHSPNVFDMLFPLRKAIKNEKLD